MMIRHMLLVLLLLIASTANAHFVFVVPDAGGDKASVILSENLKPDEDVDIKLIAATSLQLREPAGKDTPVVLGQPTGHAYRVELPGRGTRIVHGSYIFGVRERAGSTGFLITYHPKAIVGDPFAAAVPLERDPRPAAEIMPAGRAGEVAFRVMSKSSPAAGAQVTVLLPDGNEEQVTTDATGLTPSFKLPGRYGAWARVVEPVAGEHGGKAYRETRHYPTLVIDVAAPAAAADAPILRLPEAVSSFGAAACDGWLYVYGGHTAPTHTYHTTAVSGRFNRLKLGTTAGAPQWEALPDGPPLQGMNLVARGGKVYRIGGMAPRNAQGETVDNHSVADCAVFDPATRKWSPLPSLPEPRSSHDVVAVGGRLFVVGGWQLRGADADEGWPEAALVLDPASEQPKWQAVPQPFRRRALIASVHHGKVYAIGGFDENDKPSRRVDVYDPANNTWSAAPELPLPARNGFGPAACTTDDSLFVSVADGSLYRLDGAAGWARVATTTPRIVHRLVPFDRQVLVIGGADKGGNFDLIETVSIDAPPEAAGTAAAAEPSRSAPEVRSN